MFSIAFMVVVFVPGNPETQTVSHSFPKVWAALQRKSGTGAACRAGRAARMCSAQSLENESVRMALPCVLFQRCDDRLPNEEVAGFCVDLAHRN